MEIAEFVNQINTLTFTSKRLQLRKMRESDFELALRHERDAEMMRYIKDIDFTEALEHKVRRYLGPWQGGEGEWLALAVVLPTRDKVIGMVCLKFESLEYRRVEIGYRFEARFRGQGYAHEAVKCVMDFLWHRLRVNKILAYCVAENMASYRLMERLGMQREGCLRRHATLRGQWHDELIYGMLASDR